MNWQPIETAPTEHGSKALLAGLEYNKGPGYWISTGILLNGEWWENDDMAGCPLYPPTHWMPLPPAPEPKV